MAPNPRVTAAFKAMGELGIDEKKVKPVLKNILRTFEKNWELIEAENYRVLIDAIFDAEEAKDKDAEEESQLNCEPGRHSKRLSSHESSSQNKKSTNADPEDDMEEEFPSPLQATRPFKRLRKSQEGQVSPSSNTCNPMLSDTSLIRPKVEKDELLGTHSSQQPRATSRSPESRAELQHPISPGNKNKGKQPFTSKPMVPLASHGVHRKEMVLAEPRIVLMPKGHKQNIGTHQLIKPKDEPFTDDMAQHEVPIAVILPDPSNKDNPVLQNGAAWEQSDQDPMVSQERVSTRKGLSSSNERNMNLELATVEEESCSDLEVASSPLGEVKLSFSCNSAIGRPDFQIPNLDAVIKLTEEKCLHSYKIIDPNFSLKNLLGHMCESFLDLGTNSNSESQDGSISIAPNLDALRKNAAWDAAGGTKETLCMQSCFSSRSVSIECANADTVPQALRLPLTLNGVNGGRQTCGGTASDGVVEADKEGELEDSRSLVVVQQCDPDDLRSYHDIDDITKGEERIRIPWVNEMNSEHPPSFFYTPQSLVFHGADVNFRLSGIEDGNYCTTCLGDCLSASVRCVCACQTGGKFAYTPDGLVKDDFLEECLSMIRNPQQHRPFYCKRCPLERVKNDDCLEPCKGHLQRNFIRECWRKCGCHRQCGNRVVQRGLTCKLQVFFTSEGKGWGLRTLEDLPKGAFVCEYVGEVLTSKELHERNVQSARSGKRIYPALLDANWGSKADLKDEEALCLDATKYGNVARFINHRCLDANLVDIPVEVETPERCYYHLAFFTTRKVDALEELSWDYGIDFDDHDHPVKVFQCRCGSKFCRNMKRSNRSRSASR